jgi:hypothetical protein
MAAGPAAIGSICNYLYRSAHCDAKKINCL